MVVQLMDVGWYAEFQEIVYAHNFKWKLGTEKVVYKNCSKASDSWPNVEKKIVLH